MTAPTPAARPPRYAALPELAFGRLAVLNHLVGPAEVEEGLELQAKIRDRLGLSVPIGRILYERGHLRPGEVEAILAAQHRAGRRPGGTAPMPILKLTPVERDVLAGRLLAEGAVTDASLEGAARTSEALSALGLWLDPLEVLALEEALPAGAVEDVFSEADAFRRRHEPPAIEIALPLPRPESASADWAEGLPEEERLFGLLARLAGAVGDPELSWAREARETLRDEHGIAVTIERLLLARHGEDPVRARSLLEARARKAEILGRSESVPAQLSALEREAVRRRLAGCGPDDRALRRVAAHASVGIELTYEDALLEVRGPSDPLFAGLLAARVERDRRLLGGWNRRPEGAPASDRERFEEAFREEAASPRWNRGSLGVLAVERGKVEPGELAHGLYVQLRARELGVDKPIGEVLVELGHLDVASLEGLLEAQRDLLRRSSHAVFRGPGLREDRDLCDRLVAAGILDRARIEENARIRDRLRSLGLERISLAEVLRRRGEVEEEILAGLSGREAPVDEQDVVVEEAARLRADCARAAGRAAELGTISPERLASVVARRRWGPIVAAAALLAIVAATAWWAGRAGDPGRVLVVERDGAGSVEEPPVDQAGFAEAMRERGWSRVGGCWIHASEALPGEPGPGPSPDRARAAFAEEMRRRGYREVEGSWFRPDAFERLVEEEERAGQGLVRARGRWRAPADLARAGTPGDRGAGEESVGSLEAVLRIEPGRTRIGLRLESRLPAGTLLVLTLAERARSRMAFHSAPVRLPGPGRVELEVDPVPRPLGAGRYRVALDYLPSFQPEDLAGPTGAATWSIELDVPDAGPAGRDEAAVLIAILDEVEHALSIAETDPEAARLEATGAFDRLARLARIEDGAGRTEVRDRVARALRIACEVLCAPEPESESGRAEQERARVELDSCRELLATGHE